MDLLFLERLVSELSDRLDGVRLDQTYALPREHMAVVLGIRGGPRLWFCSEPEDPHLYVRPGGHPSPARPPAFAMAARKLLSGRRLQRLELVGRDRVVRLRVRGDDAPSLIFELIPRRATALLLDAVDRVHSVWHPRRGRPEPGDTWEPPDPFPGQRPDELREDDWEQIAARGDPEAVARGLLRALAGMSKLAAREAAARHAGGVPLGRAARDEMARARQAADEPRIYGPVALEDLSRLPDRREFFMAPYPMTHAGELVATPFDSLQEAAATFYPLRARLALRDRVRDELGNALEVARARAERALEAVASDRERHHDPEEYRRRGDLLLARPDAEVVDGCARVPDHYGEGDTREIPVDPSRSLVENAQRYYRKAQRAERADRRTRQRRAALEARQRRLRSLEDELEDARDLEDWQLIARKAAADGADVHPERWEAPEALWPERDERPLATVPGAASAGGEEEPAGGGHAGVGDGERRAGEEGGGVAADRLAAGGERIAPGVVAYRSSDGYEILVGRNARGNDRITTRLASPHDWWLHAEGPGSHVVIRNPERLDEPPADTLREAAALAAWFSRARGATKVNVSWTRVRDVKKPKGGPPGQVLLRRHATYLAEPVAPGELLASGS